MILKYTKLGKPETVLELFRKMDGADVKPDSFTISYVLKTLGSLKALSQGRGIHRQIMIHEFDTELVLGNGLIDMYAKCGNLDDAYNVFERLDHRDAVSWGTMVGGYVHQGQYLAALKLFERMQSSGLRPSHVTLLVAMKACSGIQACGWGKALHGQIIERAYESDVLIGSTIVDFYAKCGCLQDALSVFEKLQSRNDVSWSALIGGYAQYGQNSLALKFFERMQQGGVTASKVTFLCVSKACGNMEALDQGRLIHHQIIVSGLQVDMLVGSSLLDMYAKCGELEAAQTMFDCLPKRDVVSWSAMIAGYSQLGHGIRALQCFEKMQEENIRPNKVTFLCSLKACGSAEALLQGQLIHDQIIRSHLEADNMVASSLIDMYGKCGRLEDAHCLFQMLHNPDAVAWGAIIAVHAQHEQGISALDLFFQMQSKRLRPDKFIFSCSLKACGIVGALLDGKLIYYQVVSSGFDSDKVINNALVDMFGKCASLREAREVFDKMSSRDAITWGTMIVGYAQNGFGLLALELFDELCQTYLKPDKVIYVSTLMACANIQSIEHGKRIHEHILQSSIELDEVLGSNLLDMYVKCSDLEAARKVFDDWPKRSVMLWDVMIAGYVEHGLNDSALELFGKIVEEQLAPNIAILACVLKACGVTGALDKGRYIHNMIIKGQFETDVVIGSTLVDMHVKCGRLYEAHHVLNRLANRNVVSWGALIAGYAQHGSFLMVRYCLQAMKQEGVMPNDTIFLNILTACGHTAHLDDGLEFFKLMNNYGIMQGPEHYSCMVDLLGRAGALMEASDILNSMPLLLNDVGQTSLLGNSNAHGNVQLGSCCFEQLYLSAPVDGSGSVRFSSIYADVFECKDDGLEDLKATDGHQ
ncbi:hypothetical protein GOP47_0007981 [Adiantum capillus-veneris]|uniref:Pentatricopeptide repeat-containing protein n=1 Tax=Adiantum capillus-veneris TaxID=13818 RepID=A0A9D4ZLG6_ADICA|nr:hypothetical protein GOP47_0007981 [Adiantum capillus-veneris]